MSVATAPSPVETGTADPASIPVVERARRLVPTLAERAPEFDEADRFVAPNYALLKEAGLVEAGVPRELGGSGAEVRELAEKLQGAEPLLRRIATERIIILSSGGSDWIGGSGRAEKVEGGYRIFATKVFSSGSPAADLMMTTAIVTEEEGDSVIHFAVPMTAPEVRVLDNWRALGMRGTGSNDVVIDGFFVPDAAVALKRKAGEWHPLFQVIASTAFPLVYAVYLGLAERARDIAIGMAKQRRPGDDLLTLAGRMETALRAARLAHDWMVRAVERNQPSAESVNDAMTGRTLVAENAIRTVELAMELVGGAGFHRRNGLERLFRDIQGARFHPLQPGPQARYAGAMALGLPVSRIF